MKLRTACTTVAIALAACAVSPSLTYADELTPTQQDELVQSPLQQLSIGEQLAQLKIDIAEETYSCVEISERVDNLVERIDDLLDASPENKLELIEQRKFALGLRKQIKCDHAAEAGENGTMLTGSSCNCGACSGAGGGVSGGGIVVSGGGGGAAGGGAAGGGGIGSVAGLAAIGAAIAIPIAVSGDSGSPGQPASPSESEVEINL